MARLQKFTNEHKAPLFLSITSILSESPPLLGFKHIHYARPHHKD